MCRGGRSGSDTYSDITFIRKAFRHFQQWDLLRAFNMKAYAAKPAAYPKELNGIGAVPPADDDHDIAFGRQKLSFLLTFLGSTANSIEEHSPLI